MADEPIVLKYQPKNPGDGFVDVPRRDLTQRDVDALVGAALRDVLSPAGEPLYAPVDDKAATPKAPTPPEPPKNPAPEPPADAQKGGE